MNSLCSSCCLRGGDCYNFHSSGGLVKRLALGKGERKDDLELFEFATYFARIVCDHETRNVTLETSLLNTSSLIVLSIFIGWTCWFGRIFASEVWINDDWKIFYCNQRKELPIVDSEQIFGYRWFGHSDLRRVAKRRVVDFVALGWLAPRAAVLRHWQL